MNAQNACVCGPQLCTSQSVQKKKEAAWPNKFGRWRILLHGKRTLVSCGAQRVILTA